MSAAAALTEARARLAAALPGWRDETDTTHPTPAGALPAFYVAASLSGAERVAMGSSTALSDGELMVTLRAVVAEGAAGRAILSDHAASARAALLAEPADLGGALWSILPSSEDTEVEPARERIGTADLFFAVQLIT